MGSTLLRLKSVQERTGLPRSTVYALMKAGDFPKSIRLTAKAVCWDSQAVDDWIQSRIAAAHKEVDE